MDLNIQEETQTDNQTVHSITRDNFKKLIDAMKFTVDFECTDCSLNNGMIRQKTNNSISIIQVDLREFLNNLSVSFANAKQKVGIMRALSNIDENVKLEDQNIKVVITDKDYIISDPLSTLTFTKPINDFLDNKFIPENDFNQKINISDDLLIMSIQIDPYMIKRIKDISEYLEVDLVTIDVNGYEGSLSINQNNKQNKGKIISGIELNKEMPSKVFTVPLTPFRIDVSSPIEFSVYGTNKDDILLCKFSLKLNNQIPVETFVLVKLK